MDTIERIARRNRLRAEEVIRDSRLAEIWRSVGAEVRQVGSLRSGLLMKHRDIDFHIYSSPLRLEESFAAMAQLAADPAVGRIECRNRSQPTRRASNGTRRTAIATVTSGSST